MAGISRGRSRLMLLLAIVMWFPAARGWSDPALGPQPGEELTFKVSWTGLPAGRAVMRCQQPAPGAFRLTATITSRGMVELFYPVRDLIRSEGLLQGEVLQVASFLKDQHEGRHDRHMEYRFQREAGVVERVLNGGHLHPWENIPEDTSDPLTVFHAMRRIADLSPNSTLDVSVLASEGAKSVTVTSGEPVELETVLGKVTTIPVSISLALFAKRKGDGRTTVWLTDDQNRFPVRVESNLKIGFMTFLLEKAMPGQGTWLASPEAVEEGVSAVDGRGADGAPAVGRPAVLPVPTPAAERPAG